MSLVKKFILLLIILFLIGMLIPQNLEMPVAGATSADYNSNSFWFYPWGKSGTHKGVDIFASKGTAINSATSGIVVKAGAVGMGGNYVLILGPKWRFHYYAHLDEIKTSSWNIVSKNTVIGTVGDSGNAVGKPPHLHYVIATGIPYPWRIDDDPQGWRKMLYLNPITYLEQ